MKEYINISKKISSLQSSPKKKYSNEKMDEIKKNNKKISLSQMSTSGLLESAQQKYTLSNLINSVTNFKKETGSDFKIDVSSIKPNRLFHADSFHTIGFVQPKQHRTSFIGKTKIKAISPLKGNDLDNTLLNNNKEKEKQDSEIIKKSLIDYFPMDKLIKIETKFNNLISKIKNINQLREEFIEWINDFKKSPFYEFHFIFKNIFDNESPIKENISNLIKKTSNLLIISNIVCFLIVDKKIMYNTNNMQYENIIMKYIYDLVINNHNLYLLVCLFILIEEKLINNNNNNNNNNNDNIYVLRLIEQIKAYLAKSLRTFNNRLLVLNEIKLVTKKLIYIINKVMEQNIFYSQESQESQESEELLDYCNDLNKAEISRLFEIFDLIKNRNNLNDNDYVSYQNNNNNNITNNMNSQTIQNENPNNMYSKSNFYKKLRNINEHKTHLKCNSGLYIKKNIPNRQINNKKVTTKIINIIINNNNNNSNVNYNNQNNIAIDYNANKKNNNNTINPNINYDNKNKFFVHSNINKKYNKTKYYITNLTEKSNNNNEQTKTITFNVNNPNNYNNKYSNFNINNLPQFKTLNYNNNSINPEENYLNYTINEKKYSNINPNYNYNVNTNNDYYNNNDYNNNNNEYFNNYETYINNDHLLNKIQITAKPDPPFLPPKSNKSEISQKKFTLILDLDETLVRYKINENNPDEAKVIFRPGLFYFLNKVYPLFDIVIWTVATKEYADPIIDIIEENKKYFIARLFRHHATIKNNTYIKDLTNLGRDINTIIIIDDKESSFSFQKQNGILIKPFYGSYLELKNDFILYDLFKILTRIILDKSNDVRQGINKYQYEIKQKITKDFNKNNFDNIKEEKNEFYINNNNNNFIYNNITYNTKSKKNKSLKNSINRNLKHNDIINRCYSMQDSLSFNNTNNTFFSKK